VVDLEFWSLDVTQTKDLANVLRAGKLPATADIVQSEVVGPSLGKKLLTMELIQQL
jgi:SecD/SecF fusion protein